MDRIFIFSSHVDGSRVCHELIFFVRPDITTVQTDWSVLMTIINNITRKRNMM